MLRADSHSSPPALKEIIFSKTYELRQKTHGFAEREKEKRKRQTKEKILKKHMLGYFLELVFCCCFGVFLRKAMEKNHFLKFKRFLLSNFL